MQYLVHFVESIAIISFIFHECLSIIENTEKNIFCANLKCENHSSTNVCGIREENNGVRLKLFQNECELMKYGCQVEDRYAYRIINIQYCNQTNNNGKNALYNVIDKLNQKSCSDLDCSIISQKNVCGIKEHEEGFKIRLFSNKCEILKYNCEYNTNFTETEDMFLCQSSNPESNKKGGLNKTKDESFNEEIKNNISNLVIVDIPSLNTANSIDTINKTIDNFFAATHVFDLPLKQVNERAINLTTRKMLLKYLGPVKVFKPWVVKPKKLQYDHDHLPTLATCYHKCPKKCPDTYAPVCGNPGSVIAREPSLMFQNHCFMDVAQCKMFWENKSSSAMTSSYIESSFMFCLGDQLNALYRFLPLVRTLQHMGRLKKKGHYRYKLQNMRFFNNFMAKEPRLMG